MMMTYGGAIGSVELAGREGHAPVVAVAVVACAAVVHVGGTVGVNKGQFWGFARVRGT